jgi:hypothetical protein
MIYQISELLYKGKIYGIGHGSVDRSHDAGSRAHGIVDRSGHQSRYGWLRLNHMKGYALLKSGPQIQSRMIEIFWRVDLIRSVQTRFDDRYLIWRRGILLLILVIGYVMNGLGQLQQAAALDARLQWCHGWCPPTLAGTSYGEGFLTSFSLKQSGACGESYIGQKRLGETEAWAGNNTPLLCLKVASGGSPAE